MYGNPQRRDAPETLELRRQAGRWLKTLREEAGLSQRQLATKIGSDYYTFISQLESGRGRIPPDKYLVWASALGLEAKAFVKEIMRYYDPVTYDILFGSVDALKPSPSLRAANDIGAAC